MRELNFSLFGNKCPALIQEENSDCGMACIAMVLNYYGHYSSIKEIKREFSLGVTGITIQNLKEVADYTKLSARVVKINNFEELNNLVKPTILHWNANHFVVLTKVNSKFITINDPSIGVRKVKKSDFLECFTGYALELFPKNDFKKKKLVKKRVTLKNILSSLYGLEGSVKNAILLTVFVQIFLLSFPFYLKVIIDKVIGNNEVELLNILLMGFIILAIFNFFSSMMKTKEELFLGSNVFYQLYNNTLEHLFHLPLKYFESRKVSNIVSKLNGLKTIENAFSKKIISSAIDFILTIIIFVVLFAINSDLALIILASLILYSIFASWFYFKSSQYELTNIMSSSNEQMSVMDALNFIQTTKLYAKESEQISLWQRKYFISQNDRIKSSQLSILHQNGSNFIFNLSRIVMIFYAAKMALAGSFSVGTFFIFFIYSGILSDRFKNLISGLISISKLQIHLDRMNDIFDEEVENKLSIKKISTEITGDILIKDMSFSYSNRTGELFKIESLSIKSGDFVAITGPSGCGKSTLLKLLLGLYLPSQGKVLYDGIPIRRYDLKAIRQQFSCVMQNDSLIPGTIAENIALFDNTPDIDNLERSSYLALILDDIKELPMRFHTHVSENSSILSGGQKQRVLLARALYKKPKILFIDEGTAFLDKETERGINENLKQLNITRIIIAHRLNSIESADKIIEFKDGVFDFKKNVETL